MLLFCFPLPSIIITSSAVLAALPGKGRTVAAISALHGLGVQHPETTECAKGGEQEHPKYLSWVCGRETPIPAWCYALGLSLTPSVSTSTSVKKQPTQQQDKSRRRALVLQVMAAGEWVWPCSGNNAASHTLGCVLYSQADQACRHPAAPGHTAPVFKWDDSKSLWPLKMHSVVRE